MCACFLPGRMSPFSAVTPSQSEAFIQPSKARSDFYLRMHAWRCSWEKSGLRQDRTASKVTNSVLNVEANGKPCGKVKVKVREATGKHIKRKPCRLADNTSDKHPQKHASLYQIKIWTWHTETPPGCSKYMSYRKWESVLEGKSLQCLCLFLECLEMSSVLRYRISKTNSSLISQSQACFFFFSGIAF